MKTKKTTKVNLAPRNQIIIWSTFSVFVLTSCMGEVKEKINKATEGVANTSTIIKEAQKVEGRMEKLKNETALTNEQLKDWLPKEIGDLERSAFKVGQGGFAGINTVEGTYKTSEGKKKFNVAVVDGAGPTGGVMAAGYGVFGNLEMEAEDEHKHQQTVTVDGVKAQQTYFKKKNNTQLLFMYGERFLVTINSTDMDVEETWKMVEKLDLEELVDLTK